MKTLQAVGVAAILGLGSLGAQAATINFDGFSNGYNITSVDYTGGTMTITDVKRKTRNGMVDSQAWAYDTEESGNGDDDLFAEFYAATATAYQAVDYYDVNDSIRPGNVLIIQEDPSEGATPDDNARGGSYWLNFSSAVTLHSIDVFDLKTNKISFALDNGDIFYNKLYSDTSNDKTPNLYETMYFGDAKVSSIFVELHGASGAIDNIKLLATPLPAAVWLFGSVLLGFAGIRRFKK